MPDFFACRGCPFGWTSELPPTPKKWKGPCPHCKGLWGIVKIGAEKTEQSDTLDVLSTEETVHYPCGIPGVDDVLGGGLVKSAPILFGGESGTGKTTLCMLILDRFATMGKKVLYASGEQNAKDIGRFAKRLDLHSKNFAVMGNAFDADEIIERIDDERPFLAVFDSLHVMTCDDVKGNEGSASQGIAVTNVITSFYKSQFPEGCAIILSHVNKSLDFTGSTEITHLVDQIMMLYKDVENAPEDADYESIKERYLIGSKNRHGEEGVKSYWIMTKEGLLKPVHREKPSRFDPGAGKKKKTKLISV